MICNVSRLQTFQECRQKDQFLWEQHLVPNRTPIPLLTGGAVHKGLEVFFKTNNPAEALVQLEANYRERVGEQEFVLPEESVTFEREIKFSKLAFELWSRKYQEYGFQVLYPEVSFLQELPDTRHHCYFLHKLIRNEVAAEDCLNPSCFISHQLKGRCDGVVEKQGKIWLLETKTTAMTGNPFYDRWYLGVQPTAYIWGISKALGININGFIMNVIKKPNANYKGSLEDWFARDPFEREAFVRSDEDLERFEAQAKLIFNDREQAHSTNNIYMNTDSCVKYNRRCYFFELCQRHGERLEGEFVNKPPDYVEEEYFRLAGIEPPQPTKAAALVEEDQL